MRRLSLLACVMLVPFSAVSAVAGPAEQCKRVINDDTVRPYDPNLRAGLLRAYHRLFPSARMPPDERMFQAGTHIRCMGGTLLACFTGANLACSRINTSQENVGAAAFCHDNPQAPLVPAFAAGHDAAYRFRCAAGRPVVTGPTFPVYQRGFATTQWVPVE